MAERVTQGGIIVPGHAPYGYVPTAPEWQERELRCRFTIEANPRPDRLVAGRNEAGMKFVRDMERQGWLLAGHLRMVGGPFIPMPESDGSAHDLPRITEIEGWDYEISGRFRRRLMPMEVLAVRPSEASREELLGTKHSRARRGRRAA